MIDPGPYDPERLLRSFNQVWGFSEPSTYETSGIHEGYQTAHLMLNGQYEPEGRPLEWLLEDFAPVYEARATILNPGGYIRAHIDYGRPYLDRWQVPVGTVGSHFRVGGKMLRQIPGIPWQVEYWKEHELWVGSNAQPRLAILIDRAVPSPVRPPDADYEVLP